MPPRAILYLNVLPRSTGSGAELRMFSNALGYLDLGYEVEIVEVSAARSRRDLEQPLRGLAMHHVVVTDSPPTVRGRLAFRTGVPTKSAVEFFYRSARPLIEAANQLESRFPGAIHQFDGDDLAMVIPFLPFRNKIWSVHEIPSEVSSALADAAAALDGRVHSVSERREYRFLRRAEARVAGSAGLILTISKGDCQRLRSRGFNNTENLPMSIPDDDFVAGDRPSQSDGFLRILHLGRTAHLPSYRSLEFLLDQVFPQLPPSVLDRLRLLVAGASDGKDPRSTRIRQLASNYANQVEFLGFVQDLRPLFAEADIQVVASTHASGLRTRVVESWARGLPVLCTTASADGLIGIEPGVNLLLADTPHQFSQALTTILEFPHQVRNVALAGRTAYNQFYARDVVASSLAGYLATYLQITKPSEPARSRME